MKNHTSDIMDLEAILDVMGCRTRREILNLLREEPRFVSQISRELDVGQKAIIEHLRAMEELGILRSSFKKIERGRPRKYYDIFHDIRIQILVSQESMELHIIGDEFSPFYQIEEKIRIGKIEEARQDLKNIIEKYDEAKKHAQMLLMKLQEKLKDGQSL